jgi:RNA polymerase sigma-70 factor (ECF subfamily)
MRVAKKIFERTCLSPLETFWDFSQFRSHSSAEFAARLAQDRDLNLARAIERHILIAQRHVRREFSMEQLHSSVTESNQRLELFLTHSGPSPSAECERFPRGRIVADLLTRLPGDYREVVVLRNFQGLPFREVAQRLNRSEGAVRMLWLWALNRLRELLHETEWDDSTA